MKLKLGNHYLYNRGVCYNRKMYDLVTEVILTDIIHDKDFQEYWVSNKDGDEWEVTPNDLTEVQ